MSSRTQSGQRAVERIVRDEFGGRVEGWKPGGKHLRALVALPGGRRLTILTSNNVSGDTHNLGNFVRQHLRRALASPA